MSETKFTPAPWAIHKRASLVVIGGQYESSIASCGGANGVKLEEQQANAVLIAAAPRMYAALAKFEDRFRKQTESYLSECKITDEEAEEVLSILAAARGEANPEQP